MAFEPRTMVLNPAAFGVVAEDLPPAEGIDGSDHRYRSAIIQHRIARNVQAGLRYSEITLPRFLAEFDGVPGLSLDRQRRVLRGETGATFADLTFWSSHFARVAADVTKYLSAFLPQTAPAAAPPVRPASSVPQGRPPLR